MVGGGVGVVEVGEVGFYFGLRVDLLVGVHFYSKPPLFGSGDNFVEGWEGAGFVFFGFPVENFSKTRGFPHFCTYVFVVREGGVGEGLLGKKGEIKVDE